MTALHLVTLAAEWASLAAGWVPLAHFGHWYHSLLYALPIVLLILLLAAGSWRDRRKGERREPVGQGEGGAEATSGRDRRKGKGREPE